MPRPSSRPFEIRYWYWLLIYVWSRPTRLSIRHSEANTTGRLIYELNGDEWNIAPLRLLLEEMIPDQQQIIDFEIEFANKAFGTRHFLLNARKIIGAGDRPDLILLAMDDITDRKEAARHQELMTGELSHRVKNMLTVVQSIATQTRRHSPSPAAFDEAFQGRLQALASANDAMIEGSWKGVSLREIIQRALEPFGVCWTGCPARRRGN